MALQIPLYKVTQGELMHLSKLTRVEYQVAWLLMCNRPRLTKLHLTVRVSNHQAMALAVAQHQQSYPNSPLTEAMSLCVDDQHSYVLLT